MKNKKWANKIGMICLLFVMFCVMIPLQAKAAEKIDLKRPVSLTIYHEVNEQAVPEVEYSIYRVADVAGDDMLAFTKDFQKYSLSLKDLDNTKIKNLADALQGYVLRDKIKPFATSKTDANGVVVFPTENVMNAGMYLVLGKSYTTEEYLCNIQPMLVSLPNQSADGEYLYDLKMESKYEILEKEKTTQMSVLKTWKDVTREYRPSKIEVQLIDNATGKVQDTVILNSDNNWRYTWKNLPEGHVWSIIENEVPKYYTVSSERVGTTVELTNTSDKKPTPPPATEDSTEDNESTPSSGTSQEKLPQTGTSWWAVPVLAVAGLGFIITGMIRRQKDE